jgi:hypothetical protein
MTKASEFPVFHDPLGRRWRRIRRIWLAVSVIVTALAVIFIASVFAKPVLPGFNLKALKPKPPNIPANPTERKARKASYESLKRNLDHLDWVVAEWSHLQNVPDGTDPLVSDVHRTLATKMHKKHLW